MGQNAAKGCVPKTEDAAFATPTGDTTLDFAANSSDGKVTDPRLTGPLSSSSSTTPAIVQSTVNSKPTTRQERIRARIARDQARLEFWKKRYALQRELKQSLSSTEVIGKLLQQLQSLGSLEQLERLMMTGDDYPVFKRIWGGEEVLVDFQLIIEDAMLDAISQSIT
ncbi:hypothetical protein ABW21_db0201832 [Orbilia brochopaga]|nr:hypothetical protein ABW21_db0201832 [Drechslerella brochopaga]